MPMHQVARLEYAHEPQEDGKAFVARVVPVVDPLGRRVREDDVDIAAEQDPVEDQAGHQDAAT